MCPRFLLVLILFISGKIIAGNITTEVFKTTNTRQLTLKVYTPSDIKEGDKRSAIVFFFGGGWKSRRLNQFEPQAEYLCSKGMVCFIADYRVWQTDSVHPIECIKDAKSAIRYVRKNSERFNVNPDMIVASGGSAGGHLAAATAYVDKFNDENDDLNISPKPNALVLFNPVVDNSETGYGYKRIKDYFPDFSPAHNVKNPVPTIYFLGDEDIYITVKSAEEYKKKCEDLGGVCDLHIFEGRKHGFFNKGDDYDKTLKLSYEFLVRYGFISE